MLIQLLKILASDVGVLSFVANWGASVSKEFNIQHWSGR